MKISPKTTTVSVNLYKKQYSNFIVLLLTARL